MTSSEDRESCAAFKHSLAHRLRYVRCERFGEEGVQECAALLKVSLRTWASCEACGAISGGLLLRFIEVTQVEPSWLLRGLGPCYRTDSEGGGSTIEPSTRVFESSMADTQAGRQGEVMAEPMRT